VRTFALLAVCLSVAFAGCGGEEKKAAPKAARLDHSTPHAFTVSLFAIARQGNLADLAGLAAPEVSSRKAQDMAALAEADVQSQLDFKTEFGAGKIIGEKIHDDKAEVEIRLGAEGQKAERLLLVKIDGKWYLQDF
jgi:hypothetical protein